MIPEPEDISLVYDSQNSSPTIRVIDKDSTLVQDNVYLFTTTFWNSGNLPIEPGDVRVPVKLTISPCKKILDYNIIAVTHPEISKFTVTEVECIDSLSKSLMINWSHLDPGFGLKIQVTHTGVEKPSINFDGMIVGVDKLKDGRPLSKRDILTFNILFFVPIVVIFLILKISGNKIDSMIAKLHETNKFYGILFNWIMVILFLCVFIFMYWSLYSLFFKGSSTPF